MYVGGTRNMKKKISLVLILCLMLTGCGSTDSSVDEKTEETTALTTASATEAVTTEDVVESSSTDSEMGETPDFTKGGIWTGTIPDGSIGKFIMYDDGTGVNTENSYSWDIKWAYFEKTSTLSVVYPEFNVTVKFDISEEDGVVIMTNPDGGNYYEYQGNDFEQADKEINEQAEARGDGEEKVDGATIVKKNGKEEKIYDTPVIMLDDEYITFELNSVFIEYDTDGNVAYAGMDYNVINKSEEHNAWIIFYDYYIGDTKVELNLSPMGHSFDSLLRAGKRTNGNQQYGDSIDIDSVEDLEGLSFSAQIYINDSIDSYGGGDYNYVTVLEFPQEQ